MVSMHVLRNYDFPFCDVVDRSQSAHCFDKMSDVIDQFHRLMNAADRRRPLLLVLDSVDQLLSIYDAYRVTWLPSKLPPFVKLIVSTLDEGYSILDNLRTRYENAGATFLELSALGQDLGLEVINRWLEKANRRLTSEQTEIVKKSLEVCSLPLYARILFNQICQWRSYDTASVDRLPRTVQTAIGRLYEQMEQKFGRAMVRHSLSYLTAARHGLSEVELEHILSLDDVLLNDVYSHWKPPVRRVPPLLWTRIRADVSGYIVERSADDQLVLAWYHRQFSAAITVRYLTPDPTFTQRLHAVMADFFSGCWSGGRLKPFHYTQTQMKRFGLSEANSKADRKVPAQPYRTEMAGTTRINQRKLSELLWHLLASEQRLAAKKESFFNYDWLYSRMKCSGTSGLLHELEYFMATDNTLQQDIDMKTLVSNLQLIRPYVDKFPESLAVELSSRLTQYVGHSSSFTGLIHSCDTVGVSHCGLIPLLSCFEPADLGLQQNIAVRSSEPWHEGGAIAISRDMSTMYLIDYDDQDLPSLSTWDVATGDKLSEIRLQRSGEAEPADSAAVDIYIECRLIGNDEAHLLALYVPKYYGLHRNRVGAEGFADVIRVADGTLVRRIRQELSGQPFHNCILYVTDNWVALRYGWSVPLFALWQDRKIGLTKPHRLTGDEAKFILVRCKRSTAKYYHGPVNISLVVICRQSAMFVQRL